ELQGRVEKAAAECCDGEAKVAKRDREIVFSTRAHARMKPRAQRLRRSRQSDDANCAGRVCGVVIGHEGRAIGAASPRAKRRKPRSPETPARSSRLAQRCDRRSR